MLRIRNKYKVSSTWDESIQVYFFLSFSRLFFNFLLRFAANALLCMEILSFWLRDTSSTLKKNYVSMAFNLALPRWLCTRLKIDWMILFMNMNFGWILFCQFWNMCDEKQIFHTSWIRCDLDFPCKIFFSLYSVHFSNEIIPNPCDLSQKEVHSSRFIFDCTFEAKEIMKIRKIARYLALWKIIENFSKFLPKNKD